MKVEKKNKKKALFGYLSVFIDPNFILIIEDQIHS